MLGWLKSELNAFVGAGAASRHAIDLSDRKVTLVENTAAGPRALDAAVHTADDFELQLQRLRRRVTRRAAAPAPVDVLLPPELTLARIETFPGEARENLRDEAWWRLDAMSPYRPEEVCYDVALLDVEPQTGFLTVSICLAPRDIVEEAVAYAGRWGFAPQRVSTSGAIEGFPNGPLFLQAEDLKGEARSLRRGAAVLTAAAIGLAVVGVGRGLAERSASLETETAQAVEAETTLAQTLDTRSATLAFADRAGRPARRRVERALAVDLLDALAAGAPPETVLDRVTLDGAQIRIEGAAANADAVLAALNVMEEFEGAVFAETPGAIRAGARRVRFAIEAWLVRSGVEAEQVGVVVAAASRGEDGR